MSYLGVQSGAFAPSGLGDLFFLASVAGIRDLRTVEDPRRQRTEMTGLLKNDALAGAAIDLPALRGVNWSHAVGAGLFRTGPVGGFRDSRRPLCGRAPGPGCRSSDGRSADERPTRGGIGI